MNSTGIKEAPGWALEVLTRFELASTLSATGWDSVLPILRDQGLLARLHSQLSAAGLLGFLPERIREHLLAARAVSEDHERMIRWEVDRIQRALSHRDIPVVLLKGAAYVAAELPPAKGRLVSDVDILVPQVHLDSTELALVQDGWQPVNEDEYDQRYYREWMHEIPPLRHGLRQTDVDVHHAILPKTARITPDSKLLLAEATKVKDGLFVLSPSDMVLHSATHLFYDGDLDHGLRDLLDLHDLLTHFGENTDIWHQLMPRAVELELQRPLFYALRYCRKYLSTNIPESVTSHANAGAPNRFTIRLMDFLVDSALYPSHPAFPSLSLAIKRWLLYVRSHYIRMPLYLLVPHLFRKALRR